MSPLGIILRINTRTFLELLPPVARTLLFIKAKHLAYRRSFALMLMPIFLLLFFIDPRFSIPPSSLHTIPALTPRPFPRNGRPSIPLCPHLWRTGPNTVFDCVKDNVGHGCKAKSRASSTASIFRPRARGGGGGMKSGLRRRSWRGWFVLWDVIDTWLAGE